LDPGLGPPGLGADTIGSSRTTAQRAPHRIGIVLIRIGDYAFESGPATTDN
jgi:hypothetical protein